MLSVRRLVVGVLSLCLICATACQTAPPDQREVNKQVVRDMYAALDGQDYERLNALVQPGTVAHLVGTEEGVPWEAVVSEMVPSYYNAFQGYHHVVDQLVAEGDWVVARVTFSGTHTAEFQGVPPTGNAFTYGGVHLARIVEGKVQEFWLLEDDLGLMRQLGMDLAPQADGMGWHTGIPQEALAEARGPVSDNMRVLARRIRTSTQPAVNVGSLEAPGYKYGDGGGEPGRRPVQNPLDVIGQRKYGWPDAEYVVRW